jgi:glyoxylase-like metal-dependent hydrolase (beta-lactamase superfamily II)
MNSVPEIRSLYHQPTSTWSHVVWDPGTRHGLIVDPVMDYDAPSGRTGPDFMNRLIRVVENEQLEMKWILETHAHADHLTAGAALKDRFGCPLAIGSGICAVQSHFKNVFNIGEPFRADGSDFDRLLDDGDRLPLGALEVAVMHTPGHTNDSVTYVIGDAAFIGDTLFTPEYGTARCDFPGGDARRLFQSIQRIFGLGDDVRLYLCHDYPETEREPRPMVTVREQRSDNVHVREGTPEEAFVEMRQRRDRSLPMPTLILPSIQVNIRAGRLPGPEGNGVRYLKIPLDLL